MKYIGLALGFAAFVNMLWHLCWPPQSVTEITREDEQKLSF